MQVIDEKLIERFLSKVDKITSDKGCWLWLGGKDKSGYGQFNFYGRTKRTHRFSYMIFKGEIAKDKQIRHKCDNPSCVNPDHLDIGTQQDNMNDMKNRNRQAKGENYSIRGDKNGTRLHPETRPRGESQYLAKLTEEQVIKIRELYATGNYTQQELANKFNVLQCTISDIINNKTWKHIKDCDANYSA